jgi:nucleoid-associated protein YgaU
MRKDVRLGLAVGGVLVGVILVYVIFFSGGNHDGNSVTQNVATENARIDKGPGTLNNEVVSQSGSSVPSVPGTLGNNSGSLADSTGRSNTRNEPVEIPANRDRTASSNGDSRTSSDTGSATDLSNVKDFRWDLALNQGAASALLARSETPTPQASPGTHREQIPSRDAERNSSTPSTGANQGPHNYTVKQGDTFWTIAHAEYGDGSYYSHIMRANPNVTPNRLRAGMSLKIPGKTDVVPASAAAQLSQAAQSNRAIDAQKEYRVGAGESLYVIAKKLYGRADKVNAIYDLNKELIGPNPAALKKGMILRLPELPASTSAAAGETPLAGGTSTTR